MKMTKDDAIVAIIREGRKDVGTLASFNKMKRACLALELNAEETKHLLAYLDFIKYDTGEPYEWLAQQIEAKAVRS